jgi:magnesium transporter
MPEITAALTARDAHELRRLTAAMPAPELAEVLARLEPHDQAVLFRFLEKDRALAVFEKLEPAFQALLLDALNDDETMAVLEEIDPDDRAELLDEMPAKVAARLLAGVSPPQRWRTGLLLGYPPESAGRIMTPEYVTVPVHYTAAEALERIRAAGVDAETIYVTYVLSGDRKVLGVMSLKDLVLAHPDTPVEALMVTEVITARVDEDQEVVARRLQDHDLIAIPIVDREDRLVGIVTVDDAMDVLRQENTEDVTRVGGSLPLDRPYAAAGVFRIVRSRVGWLLILFVAEALTGTVLRNFEHQLEAVVALAFFIPLLIDTGGNAGSQTATTIIRAMAIGEIRSSDVFRVVSKELRVAALLGLTMAAAGALRAAMWNSGSGIILTVGLSLIAMVMLAALMGSILPMVVKSLNLDPAVVSAPFITTFVDATGLFIYFQIARWVMGI